jgi:hypothetical protein
MNGIHIRVASHGLTKTTHMMTHTIKIYKYMYMQYIHTYIYIYMASPLYFRHAMPHIHEAKRHA